MASSEQQVKTSGSSSRVAVIGGGVAGLSAALTLHEAGLNVTVIEAEDYLGGKIRTERSGDYIIEAGPDSILSYKPAGLALIERIGLLERVINTREDGQGTHILHKGILQPLPEGMTGLVPVDVRSVLGTPLLSWPGKLRLALEYLLPARREGSDESVGSFVRRRLGNEFYRHMAEPLLSGIYAGDADELSLQATFPQLRKAEQQHGGLIRSALAQRPRPSQAGQPSIRRTPFISLDGGLGTIIEGLAAALTGADIRTGVRVTALRHVGTKYQIAFETGEALDVDGVVVATPAWAAAALLRSMAPQLARELDAIPHVSTATISMAFATSEAGSLTAGRGFVIPRVERRALTAVTVSSNKFAGRAPADCVLVRGYIGRANDQESLDLGDADLIAVFRRELAEITGLTAEPLCARVYRWPRALPQYVIGHPERVSKIESLASAYPAFALTGGAYRGVGIPDCIQDGINQATRLAQQCGSQVPC